MANGRATRRQLARRRTAMNLSAMALLVASCGGGADESDTEASASSTTTEPPTTTTESTTTTETTTTTAPPTTTETTTTTRPSTTTTAPPTTTTTAPPTTTTTAPVSDILSPGDRGPEVRALQETLADLSYWHADPDGQYGETTRQAVMAFQKAEGLARDGVAGPQTRGRLADAGRPAARSSSGNLIEVDLDRQLMFIVQDGQVRYTLNTSSGAPGTPTPPGRFTIDREIDGWRHAELGTLYRPKYFNRGIALHGYGSVPAHPASHGCTRLSNAATDMLWASGLAEVGTEVWVY